MTTDISTTYGPSLDRPSELPWEDHHGIAEESANKLGGRIKHCLRSAFDHLRRAWTLHPIDSEMSLFRAITAEEEAATALILAMKQRRYPGSEKLNPWEHPHKAAVSPFLDAVGNLLAETGMPPPRLSINRGHRPMLSISLDLGALTGKVAGEFATVDHPFNYMLRMNHEEKAYMFDAQLQQLASSRGEASIRQLVHNEANLRNRLLYATDQGIPEVRFNDSVILKKRDRVYRLALLTIGVLQTKQHQLFAVQCLQAYCAVIGQIVQDLIPVKSVSQPEGFLMSVIQQPDGTYLQTTSYRMSADIKISGRWLDEMRVSIPAQPVEFPKDG
ncbi:hypothetical protein AAIH70_24320 [Neorhizobium sp. BT27B]|uniref:hypothetical protein n=1 Tax=Neorhizobium sp. BT27B TaxID=3142625 RepID=UPI003D2D3E9F